MGVVSPQKFHSDWIAHEANITNFTCSKSKLYDKHCWNHDSSQWLIKVFKPGDCLEDGPPLALLLSSNQSEVPLLYC